MPKLNPYLISGLNVHVGFLGPAEGILIVLLRFSLGCCTLALFWYYFCPCPLHQTIPDIFLWFSLALTPSFFSLSHFSFLFFFYLLRFSLVFTTLPFFSHLHPSTPTFTPSSCTPFTISTAGFLAHGCTVRWSSPCLFGTILPFILL